MVMRKSNDFKNFHDSGKIKNFTSRGNIEM